MDEKITRDNIAKLRIARRMTPRSLAEKLRVDDATIIAWETGESVPSEADLSAIAEALKVDMAVLTAVPKEAEEEEEAFTGEEARVRSWSWKEQRGYWEKKWKNEHKAVRYGSAAAVVIMCLLGFFLGKTVINAIACLAAIGIYLKLNNDKMTYIESKVKGNQEV